MKDKKGKLPYRLLDPIFVEGLVKVLLIGSIKYGPDDWKTVPAEDYLEASYRHLQELLKGNIIDKEGHLHHALHLATNMMFVFNLMEEDNADTQLSGRKYSNNSTATSPRSSGTPGMSLDSKETSRSRRSKIRKDLESRFNSVLDHCRPFECTRAHLVDVLIRECFESIFGPDH